ncbi:hypothetical protein DXG01_016809 [Tephrocybe rancida]|nr:hypothetical protein DXG01_016809 [Tephrocybe rancida]
MAIIDSVSTLHRPIAQPAVHVKAISTSTPLDTPNDQAAAFRPGRVSTFFGSDVHNTTLPMYQSPRISGQRSPHSFRFDRKCTWNALRGNIFSIVFVGLRKVYHITFLGAPVFYRNRVRRIFKEVWLGTDDLMERMIQTLAEDQARLEQRGHSLSSAAYFVRSEEEEIGNLKVLWESFIDLSIREWKTTNLVSILLLS